MKKEKETNTVTFRPNGGAKEVLKKWDATGYPRTILINTLISRHGENGIEEILPTLRSFGVMPKRKGGAQEPCDDLRTNRLFSRQLVAA